MNSLLVALSLCLAAPNAEESVTYEQDASHMAVARVKNWASGYKQPGPAITGSGTLTAVDGSAALVLTAAHLFEKKMGPITVEFADGQLSGARVLAIDRKLDVAALWIYAPRGIEPLPISTHDPALGEAVEICGFGPKRFRAFAATVSKPIPMAGDLPETLVAAQGVQDRQVTIPGDSGGPILHDGLVVAVHWGYRGQETDPRRGVHALGATRLSDWLKSELPAGLCRRCLVEPSLN